LGDDSGLDSFEMRYYLKTVVNGNMNIEEEEKEGVEGKV